jgi:putative sigma-54 modulation protein
MSTEISGRNFEVTPALHEMIETKLARLTDKLFDDVIEIRCVLQLEKYRNICEILIVGKEHDVKAVQESDDSMQDAVNATLDHLKRQAQKNREKIRDHHRKDGGASKSAPVTDWTVQILEPGRLRHNGDDTGESRPRIIKTSNLPIRAMSIEDAALRLDDSKNEFIVFRDLDNDRVSVMYKRQDQNLGLIAPEF